MNKRILPYNSYLTRNKTHCLKIVAVLIFSLFMSHPLQATSVSSSEGPVVTSHNLRAIENPAVRQALQKAALREFKHNHWVLVNYREQQWPVLGETTYSANVRDHKTQQVTQLVFDLKGKHINLPEIKEQERKAKLKKQGKLDDGLLKPLQAMKSDEQRWVALFLPYDTQVWHSHAKDRKPEQISKAVAWLNGELAKRESAVFKLLPKITERQERMPSSPFLMVKLDKKHILKLSRNGNVGAIYDAERADQSEAMQAQSLAQCPFEAVPNHYQLTNTQAARAAHNVTGKGVKLAVFQEPVCDHDRLLFDPTDSTRVNDERNYYCNDSSVHGNLVTSYIQNLDPGDPETPSPGPVHGMAPDVEIHNVYRPPLSGSRMKGFGIRNRSYIGNISGQTHEWKEQYSNSEGFRGPIMAAVPKQGAASGPASLATAPRLDYQVRFLKPGTYYVHVDAVSDVGKQSTVHIGVGGAAESLAQDIGPLPQNRGFIMHRARTNGTRPTISIPSAGTHTVNVWMGEPGTRLRALAFSLKELNYFSSVDDVFWASYQGGALKPITDLYQYFGDNDIHLASSSMSNISCSVNNGQVECENEPKLIHLLADYYTHHHPYTLSFFSVGNDENMPNSVNLTTNNLVIGAAKPYTSPGPGQGRCNPQPCAPADDRTKDMTVTKFTYRNPPSANGDWELPHMVAYGRWLHSPLGIDENCMIQGTSFSTPMVAGAAALILEAVPELAFWPPAVKALLMAGADVNTDLNTPSLGSNYTYLAEYNNPPLSPDRRGGVGLLNVLASVDTVKARLYLDNRKNLNFDYALGEILNNEIINFQRRINPSTAPQTVGYDYGTLFPETHFEGKLYRSFYYFTPPSDGNLRMVLAWDKPVSCTIDGANTTCSKENVHNLDMVLRDLDDPTGSVGLGAAYDTAEEFLVAPVKAGKTYRLEITKQDLWNKQAIFFGLAAHFTTNDQ